MDEITILASAASALLAAGFTRLIVKPESPVLVGSRQLETYDSAHVHEATTFDASGWHCDCGKHMHSYVFDIAGRDEKRCVASCGATGTGKEWS